MNKAEAIRIIRSKIADLRNTILLQQELLCQNPNECTSQRLLNCATKIQTLEDQANALEQAIIIMKQIDEI